MDWEEFGGLLCSYDLMEDECIIMLSCCRGGLKQVAYTLLISCTHISCIIGPSQSLQSEDMLIGFSTIFYNLIYRGVDPIIACEKAKAGTDLRFVCFDRLETETEWGYHKRLNDMYEIAVSTEDNKNQEKIIVPPEVLKLKIKELQEKLNIVEEA